MSTLYRPYTTLAKVKTKCGIATATTTYDDDIKDAINKISRLIDSLTGRYYYQKTYTSEYLSGTRDYNGWQILRRDTGGLLLTPQEAPIVSISSLSENGTSLTENTDFYIHAEEGIIERNGANWDDSPRMIIISCVLGYECDDTETPSDDMPGDIAYYACELAARDSGHYKKAIKNYVSGAAETVDLFDSERIEKILRSMRPVGII